ncbi:1-deoxy-D-xylulose-5-phosphate reductoisomerase [bacterium]|nr:1-deoxy-D-xylulose-5-phosphate reductoisomerase [bacterium]
MKKKIAILGSTGSIGKTLIRILKKDINNFEIVLLSANKNYHELIKQAKSLNVKNLIITNKNSFLKLKKNSISKKVNVFNNFQLLDKIFKKKIDYTMSSISGLDGLNPTLNIIKHTKSIAIANKESIICGWNILNAELKKNRTKFIPVDSEHFSIDYALKNKSISNVKCIYLTASGGPLHDVPLYRFKKIKMSYVLKHPNWSMGKKISIDSATLMNKVFEIIEAKKIFNIPYDKLKILIHPKSYVHSLLKFNDGMIKIIAHDTSMEIPIYNSLPYKKNFILKTKELDIKKLNNLNFQKVDYKKFPLVKILNKLPKFDSLFETVIVSANDEFVKLYLNKKISFNDLIDKIYKFIHLPEFTKYKLIKPKKIDTIQNLNLYVRLKIKNLGV